MTGGASILPTNTNSYIAADFRDAREMASRLNVDQITRLEQEEIGDLVPESWTAVSGQAHAVEKRTIDQALNDYIVTGSRRESDGVWAMRVEEGQVFSLRLTGRKIYEQ